MDMNNNITLKYPGIMYTGTEEISKEEQQKIKELDNIVFGAFFDAFATIKDTKVKISDKPVDINMPSGSVLETYRAELISDELATKVLERLNGNA